MPEGVTTIMRRDAFGALSAGRISRLRLGGRRPASRRLALRVQLDFETLDFGRHVTGQPAARCSALCRRLNGGTQLTRQAARFDQQTETLVTVGIGRALDVQRSRMVVLHPLAAETGRTPREALLTRTQLDTARRDPTAPTSGQRERAEARDRQPRHVHRVPA